MELVDLVKEAKSLGAEEFITSHPDPILLIHEETPGDANKSNPFMTYCSTSRNTPGSILRKKVIALRKSDRNPFAHMVTIGRANNNDIVVDSGTVSKAHAIFCRNLATNRWEIKDLNSSNHTYLSGKILEHGQGYELSDGAVVHLSQTVRLEFYSPRGLWEKFRNSA